VRERITPSLRQAGNKIPFLEPTTQLTQTH
jgi:hypothetical protein